MRVLRGLVESVIVEVVIGFDLLGFGFSVLDLDEFCFDDVIMISDNCILDGLGGDYIGILFFDFLFDFFEN